MDVFGLKSCWGFVLQIRNSLDKRSITSAKVLNLFEKSAEIGKFFTKQAQKFDHLVTFINVVPKQMLCEIQMPNLAIR